MASRVTTRTGGRPATTGLIEGRFGLSVGRPRSDPPSGWEWVPLSGVARLETGHTPSRRHPEYWGGEIPWIGIRDATENHGRVIYDTYQHTNDVGIANSSARVLPANTVCLSRTASVGYVVVMGRPMATSQDFVNWVCSDRLDHRFLKYVLLAEHEALLRFASGTTHQTIYFPEVKAFHVSLPPIHEQRAIANVLGTLDDKIELNRRMSETLESIARAIFKSWFVDFDPVRAKADGRDPGLPKHIADLFPDRLVDSELGPIPAGWQIGKLGDVADHPRRTVNPHDVDAETPYIALEHMPKRCIALTNWGAAGGLASNKFRFRRSEILFGKLRPYFHKVGVAPLDGVCSTDIVVVNSRDDGWFGFVLGHFSSDEFVEYTNLSSTGTRMPRTNWRDMSKFAVALPPPTVAATFADLIRPLTEKIIGTTHESRSLAALRDTLLPKLISGEIRLSGAQASTRNPAG
ncbi:MAG: restriction endonuclease subunit S [Acidobacteria bacterium]|nr:MAG: restriction endonuclease subunit S [Acidobacteriota bacterium]